METFEVYRSYWRDDAQFDMSNTLELIPDIRSPKLTDEVLLRLCQYAIQHKFAWKPTRYMGRELTARDYVRRLAAYDLFLQRETVSKWRPCGLGTRCHYRTRWRPLGDLG